MGVQVYKTGIVAASGDAIGDNLIKDSRSRYFTGSDRSAISTRTFDSVTHTGKIEVVSDTDFWNAYVFITNNLTDTIPNLSTGTKTYTHSIDIRVTNYTTGSVRVSIDFRTGGTVNTIAKYDLTSNELDGKWHRVYGSMTTNNAQSTAALWGISSVYTKHSVGTIVEYKNPKLEVGSIATPWTMATTDSGYVGNIHGFMEITQTPTQFYEDRIDTIDFIEY